MNDLAKYYEQTEMGLTFREDLDFETWQRIAAYLFEIQKCVQFWVGDLLNFGERKYGEAYTQAIEMTGLSYQTLADAKWVSEAIEPSLRKETLTFSHHKEVSKLPPPKQKEFLDLAESEHLTTRELREAVRADNPSTIPEPNKYEAVMTLNDGSLRTKTVRDISNHPDRTDFEGKYPDLALNEGRKILVFQAIDEPECYVVMRKL